TIDHVIPRSRGGEHCWENCVASCAPCNHRKADKLLSELGWELRAPLVAPRGRTWRLVSPLREIGPPREDDPLRDAAWPLSAVRIPPRPIEHFPGPCSPFAPRASRLAPRASRVAARTSQSLETPLRKFRGFLTVMSPRFAVVTTRPV